MHIKVVLLSFEMWSYLKSDMKVLWKILWNSLLGKVLDFEIPKWINSVSLLVLFLLDLFMCNYINEIHTYDY